MTNTRLTEKEEMVLRSIMEESNFNCDSVDIMKSWNEQRLENREEYWAFADVKDYGCGMEKQQVRAIFGSLQRKGLITLTFEKGEFGMASVTWLTIDEEQFNRIREYLA